MWRRGGGCLLDGMEKKGGRRSQCRSVTSMEEGVPCVVEQGSSAAEVGGESHMESKRCLLVEMESLMWSK